MGLVNRPMGWKYGDMKPVETINPIALVQISKGDLIGLASGTITGATSTVSITVGTPFPASDTPWDTDLATTQLAFSSKFLGASQQANRKDGLLMPIVVATDGVHEFDCASASFKVGDLVGPAKQSGNLLEDQKVVAVSDEKYAIGKIAKAGTTVTKVLVKLFTRVMGKTPPT